MVKTEMIKGEVKGYEG